MKKYFKSLFFYLSIPTMVFALLISIKVNKDSSQKYYLTKLKKTHQFVLNQLKQNGCNILDLDKKISPVFGMKKNDRKYPAKEIVKYLRQSPVVKKINQLIGECFQQSTTTPFIAQNTTITKSSQRDTSNGGNVGAIIQGNLYQTNHILKQIGDLRTSFLDKLNGEIEASAINDAPTTSIYPMKFVDKADGNFFKLKAQTAHMTRYTSKQKYIWYVVGDLTGYLNKIFWKKCDECLAEYDRIPQVIYGEIILNAMYKPWVVMADSRFNKIEDNGLYFADAYFTLTGQSDFSYSIYAESLQFNGASSTLENSRNVKFPNTRGGKAFKDYIEQERDYNVQISRAHFKITIKVKTLMQTHLVIALLSLSSDGKIDFDFGETPADVIYKTEQL